MSSTLSAVLAAMVAIGPLVMAGQLSQLHSHAELQLLASVTTLIFTGWLIVVLVLVGITLWLSALAKHKRKEKDVDDELQLALAGNTSFVMGNVIICVAVNKINASYL